MNIERSFRDVLTAVAGPENLVSEFDNDLVSRLRRFVEDVFTEKRREQWRHFRIVLALLTIALPLLGGGLGIVFANTSLKDLSPPGKTAVWLGYAILSCFVLAVAKWLPDDVARFEQEIKRIRLVNLVERLASKIALFGLLLDEKTRLEDVDFISWVSGLVTCANLKPEAVEAIGRCIDPSTQITDPRESNAPIPSPSFDFAIREKLQEAMEQIVSLSRYMFDGNTFTAKLYFQVQLGLSSGDYTEALVPVARFPLKRHKPGEEFGTSWLKARGKQAIVWKCLESGTFETGADTGFSRDYESVLAIPLPGRIGVLALTAKAGDAFVSMSTPTYKALALATYQLVFDSIGTRGRSR